MAPTQPHPETRKGLERVRHELLTALQLGKLTPGDRAPSVRRLADRTGMNKKTVHRAYVRLAREGLLDTRRGSGTFIAERGPISDLLSAVNHCRATAASLRLPADVLGAFLDTYLGNGLRDLPLTVVECNGEQVGLVAEELRVELGVTPKPVLLSRFIADPSRAVDGSRGIVTTDCHRREVAAVVESSDVPVYRVALDRAFPNELATRARRRPVVMVIKDRAFGPIFRRLLGELGVAPQIVDRFHIVEPSAVHDTLCRLNGDAVICLSPRVEWTGPVPDSAFRVPMRWPLDSGSLDRLRAALAFDIASGRGPQGASEGTDARPAGNCPPA